MEWTKQQREAIEYRNNNILLAAAAGSGKTAVLVQRVIEMIEKDKVSVNELLVLTFTDAAASEMREKIKKAINSALRENPDDEHLRKQKLLIHSSSISTVHSFCMNTLKSNIYLTDLPVEFSLISDQERSMMLNEALDEILEMFYSRIDSDRSFADLVGGYGGIKNDKNLRDTVLALHSFSRSMAYPSKWLNDAVFEYKYVAKNGVLADGWLKKSQQAFVEKTKTEVLEIYRQIAHIIEERLPEDHPYVNFFGDEIANISRIFAHIEAADDYSVVKAQLEFYKFPNMKQGMKNADDDIIQNQEVIKGLRSTAKGIFNELKTCFLSDEDEVLERMKLTYPVLRTLKNLVMMVERRFKRKKRAKNFLDFNDLEQEMLKLINSHSDEKSEVAQRLREKYKAILFEEYQDTNNVQDAIFRAVSRDNGNIFMVGDLKQSIYKFRNAVPMLFSDKYELYAKDDNAGHLIRLFKNFRSRSGVVDTVNFVFERIMSPEVGNIKYTSDEYLVHGAVYYPENVKKEDYKTEFHVISREISDESGDVIETLDKTEAEARFAVDRINKLFADGFQVFDKEKKILRNIEYRDIVILVRSPKNTAPVIEEVFDQGGIPVYTEVGHSYLGALEIQTVMAFLQITDNPRQDIPLIAVMRSAMWNFSTTELAEIRAAKKGGCFYDAVTFAADSGNERAAEFVEELTKLRSLSEYSDVNRIISKIYYDFGYYAYVGSLKNGTERQANLRMLLEHATAFGKTKLSGLFSFMNYIETMRARGDDLVPAKMTGEGADVVRIMTVHKSKGLEFPVVFLVDTAHRFNLSDASKNFIWDSEGGIGAGYVDTHLRVRYPTLPQLYVGMKIKEDFLSEEMRLLYVALTRACEKLIITTTYSSREKSWMSPVLDEDGKVSVPYVRGNMSYREWLVAAFMLHPDAKALRDFCGVSEKAVKYDAGFDMDVFVHENLQVFEALPLVKGDDEEEQLYEDGNAAEEIKRRFDYVYHREEFEKLPVKLSVSEVKRMKSDDLEFVPLIEQLRTADMAEIGRLSGAEKGTVVHFVMQMLNPERIESVKDVENEVQRLKTEKILTDAQADAVDCEKIAAFFESGIGKRLKAAVRYESEFSFYTEVSAAEIFGDERRGKVLLQGTMDCFFVESDGKTVLLDYKTDKVETREQAVMRAEKYRVQMRYYKKAFSDIMGYAVDECYLYFMECGEFIAVDDKV